MFPGAEHAVTKQGAFREDANMEKKQKQPGWLSSNSFGNLVREYREQMGISQEDVAKQWGYTREDVSLIERGKRKLDQIEQVSRLANILQIPYERLDAIGKGIPHRTIQPQHPLEADDAILQALLAPAQATVKLSWLVWYADKEEVIVDTLAQTTATLEQAINDRRGSLLKPALQVLAYAHEMMGKIEFDRLDYKEANGHYQAMYELGEELHDHDVLALSLIRQGDLLRRRGRYELALNRLQASEMHAQHASSPHIQGMREQTLARASAEYGDKATFQRAIEKAQTAVETVTPNLDTISSQFTRVSVLEEKAQGHTLLWEPEEAITIYKETERIQPFRPIRAKGVFTILKAQAYTYAGDVDIGIAYAIEGLNLARQYQSKRHVTRVQRMYDRLRVTPLGTHPRMRDLKDALAAVH
jgi:transcriptional regulator with XRE-family HTH domain